MLLQDIYTELNLAVRDSKHAYHNFCFASTTQEGTADARVVILRDFCLQNRQIIFHTDIRSSKCEQICQNPLSSALFYAPSSKLQLKFRSKATLHYKDLVTQKRWELTSLQSRRTYLKLHAPGSIISEKDLVLPEKFLSLNPNKEDSENGFENFAVVILNFHTLEILELHHKGNECFRVDWQNEQETFNRIAP